MGRLEPRSQTHSFCWCLCRRVSRPDPEQAELLAWLGLDSITAPM